MRVQKGIWGALPLRSKLLILFTGLSAVPLVIAGTFLALSLNTTTARMAEAELSFRLEKAKLVLDRRWAEVERVAQSVAADNLVVINLSLTLTSALQESLSETALQQGLDQLFIVDDRGILLVRGPATGVMPAPESPSGKGRRFLVPVSGPDGPGIILGADVPIRDARGESLGVVAAGVKLAEGPSGSGLAEELRQASGMRLLLVVDGQPLEKGIPASGLPDRDGGIPVELALSDGPWLFRFLDLSQGGPPEILVGLGLPRETFQSWPLTATLGFLAVMVLALTVSLVLAVTVSRRFTRPITAMAEGARDLTRGRFDVRIPETSADEIGLLAREFNAMAQQLDESLTQVRHLNETLETRIEERTNELAQANLELEAMVQSLNRAREQMVESEKLAALGQLTTTIAHDLNTPLGAILSSSHTLETQLRPLMEALPGFLGTLDPDDRALFAGFFAAALGAPSPGPLHREGRARRKELARRLEEAGVSDPESQAETLSEIGLADPGESLLQALARPRGPEILAAVGRVFDLIRAQTVISLASAQAARTVEALLRYNRTEDTGADTLFDLKAEVEACLTLFHGKLKDHVEVVRDYQEVPPVRGRLDALNQVWTNLIGNGLQAMDYRGVLKISLAPGNDGGTVFSVTDSGPGIDPALGDKLFRPFFTTKKPGEGTGLGLFIARRVVEAHGGRITFESEPGRTTFTVTLPGRSFP